MGPVAGRLSEKSDRWVGSWIDPWIIKSSSASGPPWISVQELQTPSKQVELGLAALHSLCLQGALNRRHTHSEFPPRVRLKHVGFLFKASSHSSFQHQLTIKPDSVNADNTISPALTI